MCRRYAELASTLVLSALLAACGSAPPDTSAPAKASAGKDEAVVDPAAAPVEAPIPPEATQRFDQAVVHMTAGDAAAAEREFRALADAYPTYSGPLLNLGIIHAKAGRFEDAQKEINAAIERNANNAPAFNQLGIVYRKLGRFKDADAAYQRAVQIDPNYAIAYLNLGVLCDLYLQEPQRALEAYERYLSLAAAPDQKVNGWVTELKKRLSAGEPRAARAE
jgi:tetratricopeptide (TPR) repeat protein